MDILLLAAVWNGFSFPLTWTLLPHDGACDSRIQESHVARFLTLCADRRCGACFADREFIGRHWFRFLHQHGTAPCIRWPARATTGKHHLPVWAVLKKLQVGEVRVWRRHTLIYGLSLRVAATKNATGDTLSRPCRGHMEPNLPRYAQRWQADENDGV